MKSLFAGGLDKVMIAVESNVDWFFADAYEIGSSDVTACLKAVCGELCDDANLNNYSPVELQMVRSAIIAEAANIFE